MEIAALIFALIMLAAATTAAAMIWVYAGALWALGFVGLLILAYRAANHHSGPVRPASRDTLNAFQAPLSDD